MKEEFTISELLKTDLNLLLTLSILVREKSVKKTAAKLHVGSPSVSMGLNRLRELFHDPLLVRQGRQMVPTPHAITLTALIDPFLYDLRLALIRPERFDPTTVERTLRFAIAEDLETLYLHRIFETMIQKAPGLKLLMRDVDFHVIGDSLRTGEAEVVLAALYPDMIQDEPCRSLYREHFVTLHSPGQQCIPQDITMEAYINTPQILISPRGHMSGSIDPELSRLGLKRHIASTLTKFSSLPPILERMPFLANVPGRIGREYAHRFGLRSEPLPFESPVFDVGIAWQKALNNDPFTQWFIQEISNIVSD